MPVQSVQALLLVSRHRIAYRLLLLFRRGTVVSLFASLCAPGATCLTSFCTPLASFLTPFGAARATFLTPFRTRLRRFSRRRGGRGGLSTGI